MPTMIEKSHVIFEKSGQAPSPSKDFHQLLVTDTLVIWRTWRISLRKDQMGMPPMQNKQSHEDFYYDTTVTADVKRVFGEDVIRYVECIVNHDWLLRMKDEVLVLIFSYLNLPDIAHLSSVCRHFRAICNGNELWKKIYLAHSSKVTSNVEQLGGEIGWKKMFFTNKLQLQKEASRLRKAAS
ncbi:F-box only protein 36-like [Hydractinia symbiolongicarpus]|uniref:F-box only protein 36-like n=1 Tax=Hydractinia symbiolongicarpus TaxID=13093 RepID=UPI00254A7936|nr:F-box only protein 36-like [Hydractinia symbiolongicarpus]